MNEIATRNAMPINSVADIKSIAEDAAQSGLLGPCTPAKAFVIVQHCAQSGQSLLDFKMRYHVTDDGQVTMRADHMAAEFASRGGEIEWIRYDDEEARAKFYYGRNQGVEMAYSIEDAHKAGLVKDSPKSAWNANRPDMLRARLVSKAVRMFCPEVNSGVYTPEELDTTGQTVVRADDPPAVEVEDVKPLETPQTFDADQAYYSRCPVPGKMEGVKWSDMDLETLQIALTLDHDLMKPEHFARITLQIAKKTENGETNDK